MAVPSVAFASTDWNRETGVLVENGCTWYRCSLPAAALAEEGWVTNVGQPAIDPQWGIAVDLGDGSMVTDSDVTVLKLLMHRVVPPMVAEMSRLGNRIVVDVDDFHHGLHHENIAYALTDPHRNADSNRAWYEQIIRAADTVTVSTDFLADHYSRRCRDVRVVRNGIDADRYPARDVSGEPVIGWVGATPWRSGDIETLASWLPKLVYDTGVRVHHSGHIDNDPYPFGVRAGLANVSTVGMALLPEYPSLFAHFNIGLVPLAMIPFNEAKSTIKGLEYAASGIPFVAAPTREYRLLAEQGVGRVAATPDEWYEHVLDLMDEDVRVEEGQRIRALVRESHTYRERGPEWATALIG